MGLINEQLIVRAQERRTAATDASADEKTIFELRPRDRPLNEDESTARRRMRFAGFNGKLAVIIRFQGIQFPSRQRREPPHHQSRPAIVQRSSKRKVRALSCTRKGIAHKELQRMKEDELT
jgi:hypothetical protein